MKSKWGPVAAFLGAIGMLILFTALTSCTTLKRCNKRYPPVIKDSIVTQYVQTVKDTTIFISDEASIQALLECDSLGNVRMRQITQLMAGQYVKPSVVIKDRWLTAKCIIDSARVYVAWKETHVRESSVKTIEVPVEVPLSWWKSTMIKAGYVSTGILILVLIIFLYKKKLQILQKIKSLTGG